MEKRPTTRELHAPGPQSYATPDGLRRPEDLGDAMRWWLVSGGATSFLIEEDEGVDFDPIPNGVQLVCSMYVPPGQSGWLKQIRVAPYCPPQLANPWQGWPAHWQSFQQVVVVSAAAQTIRATAQAGVYTTPMGWESYFDQASAILPSWQWCLKLLPGTIDKARSAFGAAGPFSFADPKTWYLTEGIAVPASAYPGGLPFSSPGQHMPPQRMQVIQADELDLHVLIPEDNTLLLFAYWQQDTVATYSTDIGGTAAVGPRIPPLLPTFGQMSGYMQVSSSEPAQENATKGW